MTPEMEISVERIEATRRDMIDAMAENEIEAKEALSLLSGMLVQFYCELVENQSRENFISTMSQCFDAYQFITAEPEGGIH